MALHEYRWRGSTWQIDDKDIERYPGAVPVEEKKPGENKKTTPANKARRAPKNK